MQEVPPTFSPQKEISTLAQEIELTSERRVPDSHVRHDRRAGHADGLEDGGPGPVKLRGV